MKKGQKVTISDVTIIRRSRKSEGRKASYCYAIKDPLTGKQSNSKKSVAELAKKMGMPINGKLNKSDAKYIISEAIARGILHFPVYSNSLDPEQLLIQYVEKICDYETSPWVKAEAQRTGQPHSKKYMDRMKRGFQIHAKPLIPKDMTLKGFTKPFANALRDKMYENGSSPDSINSALEALTAAFNYAEHTGVVDYNPMTGVKKFIVKRKERKPLTRSEAIRVLDVLELHSGETRARKGVFLGARLVIHGGARISEIRGLSLSQFSPVLNDEGNETEFVQIDIDREWDDALKKIGPTKERYRRTTVIQKELADELREFAAENGCAEDDLIFMATRDRGNRLVDYCNSPMSKTTFENYLYEAIHEVGIDEETRVARKIDFQSLRHFYVSETKASASKMERYKVEIRDAVGHKSVSVDEKIYTHDTTTSLILKGVLSKHVLDIEKEVSGEW